LLKDKKNLSEMQEKNFAGDTVRLQSYLELLEVALIVKYATH